MKRPRTCRPVSYSSPLSADTSTLPCAEPLIVSVQVAKGSGYSSNAAMGIAAATQPALKAPRVQASCNGRGLAAQFARRCVQSECRSLGVSLCAGPCVPQSGCVALRLLFWGGGTKLQYQASAINDAKTGGGERGEGGAQNPSALKFLIREKGRFCEGT